MTGNLTRANGKEPRESPWAAVPELLKVASQPHWRLIIPVGLSIGWLVLFGYFHQIKHTPPELGGMLIYAALACAWLMLIWFGITALLFGSTALALGLGVTPREWPVVLFGQVASLLSALSYLLLGSNLGLQAYGKAVLVLAIAAWAAAAVQLYRRWSGIRSAIALFLSAFVGLVVLLGGVFLLLFVLGYAKTFDVSVVLRLVGLAILLMFALAINTLAVISKLDARWLWPSSAVMTAGAVFLLSGNGYVLGMVAGKLGIRLDQAELIVPEKTCSLVVSTLWPESVSTQTVRPACSTAANTLHADVHLRWGGQWLLAVSRVNGVDTGENSPRVTVPSDGIQLVIRPSTKTNAR